MHRRVGSIMILFAVLAVTAGVAAATAADAFAVSKGDWKRAMVAANAQLERPVKVHHSLNYRDTWGFAARATAWRLSGAMGLKRRTYLTPAFRRKLSPYLGSSSRSSRSTRSSRRTLPRGLCQPGWYMPYDDPQRRAAVIHDIRTNLHASWIRFEVFWSHAEPRPGVYDETYLDNIAATCAEAKAAGLKVLVTVFKVPEWASQKDLWQTPAPGATKGEYRDFYAPSKDALDELQAFMSHLVERCDGTVAAYECWNEPNLWMTLAPQKHGGDTKFAARRYRDMLKAFKAGVEAADEDAQVVGGAFGPYGTNDKWRTSPQRFAAQLRSLGGAKYLDVLSHHPYQAGSSHRYAPDRLPRWPSRAVSLRNLNVIMKLFPGKPVYLTEYGYNTRDCPGIGRGVGAVRQATYLRKAYAYAARYSRVKMMIWFLQRDAGGWSTGLRTETGTKKPAWYAFSQTTRIALKASTRSARRGQRVRLTGRLTWTAKGASAAAVSGKKLVLERKVGRTGWRRVRTVRTKSDGSFATTVRPQRTTRYRVRWVGVAGSTSRKVAVR